MTYNIFSLIILVTLIGFDLLEPIMRSKQLYFGISIGENDVQSKGLNKIYKNYRKKVLLITLPIGIGVWYYYPLETGMFEFLLGIFIMIVLNLFFYFLARKELKGSL